MASASHLHQKLWANALVLISFSHTSKYNVHKNLYIIKNSSTAISNVCQFKHFIIITDWDLPHK